MEEQELAPDSSRFRVNRNLINSVEKQDQVSLCQRFVLVIISN